ncbi:MAG: hypothetical protein WEC59_13340 [Salibacteraceae bacterium]
MKRNLLTVMLCGLFAFSQAQSPLNFSYQMDARIYKGNDSLYFMAHAYPVFHDHRSDSLKRSMAQLFEPPSDLWGKMDRKNTEVVSRFDALEMKDLMADEQIFSMLCSRIGLTKKNLRDTAFMSDIIIDVVSFPDHQLSTFNHHNMRFMKGNIVDKPQETHRFYAGDWELARHLQLGDLAGKKAIKCLEKSIEHASFENQRCGEESLKEKWTAQLSCETPIGAMDSIGWHFYPNPENLGCSTPLNRLVKASIKYECFEDDKPCKD